MVEIVNPLFRDDRDIKGSLRRMTAGSDALQALRGRLLLELVRGLEEAAGPRVVAILILRELVLSVGSRVASPVVRVGVDWRDYGPLRDGLPIAHYRVRIHAQSNP